MAQSYTDAVSRAAGPVLLRYACPDCGGYYDIYSDKDKRDSFAADNPVCKWCRHKMNIVSSRDMDIFGPIYILLGECRDKLRIAGVPVKGISGIGFDPEGIQGGLHDNWDRNYSIDLPISYRNKEAFYGDEFREFLYRELIRTCRGCGNCGLRWKKYVRKAEAALEFPIISKEQ